MRRRFLFLHLRAGALAAVAAGALGLAGAAAQTRTVQGNFNGDQVGSYTQTVTHAAGAGETVQIVYTRRGDRATRTDTVTTSLPDANGGYTVSAAHTDFAAAAADTLQETFVRVQPGRHTGSGSYTTASGDSGTLTAVLSRTASGTACSELRVSPTTGNTLILRIEQQGDGPSGSKFLALNPDGSLTASSLVRYATPEASASPAPAAPTPVPTPTPTPTPTPLPTPTPAATPPRRLGPGRV